MILLTGGTGFIGRHVLERLSAAGTPVRCLVRPKASRAMDTASLGATEVVAGDLESGVGIPEALAGVDSVIHLAGVTKAVSRQQYYDGNVRATTNLLLGMAGSSARLVHVSSLAAIGPAEARTQPVHEKTEPHPVSHYGKSKLEAETLVRASRPDALIVRPPVVYGPHDRDVFQVLKPIASGWSLALSGAERWFSIIYVGDLAAALAALAVSPAGAGRSYYLAHERPASWSGLATCAAHIMGVKMHEVRIPGALARAVGACADAWAGISGKASIISSEKVAESLCPAWVCDSEPARVDLGFEAPTDLERGLSQTLAWYKEAGWLNY